MDRSPQPGRHGDAEGRESGIRDALDSLIHGPSLRPGRLDRDAPAAAPHVVPPADVARRGTGAGRPALPPSVADDLTGLYAGESWGAVVAAEDARWLRCRRPCQVIQLEIAGIASLADRMGEGFADRLLVTLAGILREETRASDLYARTGRWRLQGVLPEQEADRAAQIEGRLRGRFSNRLGPDLPLQLRIGIAGPSAAGGIPEAFGTAEREMRTATAPDAVGTPVGPGIGPAAGSGRAVDVRDGLLELGRLRNDGLVTDEEYQVKRSEILARL